MALISSGNGVASAVGADIGPAAAVSRGLPGVGEATRAIAIRINGGNSSGEYLPYSTGACDGEDGITTVNEVGNRANNGGCGADDVAVASRQGESNSFIRFNGGISCWING